MKIIRFFIIAIFIILSIAVHTQSLSIGAGLSLPTYWGDLNSNRIVKDIQTNTNIGVNIGAILNVNDYWSINGGFVYGKMQGDDAQSHQAYQIDRNLNFRTNLFESNLGLMLHPFAWRLANSSLIISPFAQLSLGLVHTNPKTEFNGTTVYLQPLGTEGQGMEGFADRYSLWNFAGGAGGGVNFYIDEQITVSVYSRLMVTNTDYLDDVSRSYVNFYELRDGNGLLAAQLSDRTPEVRNLNEPLNRPTGSQRGGAAKDMYFITGISVFYQLKNFDTNIRKVNKNKVICPKFN